MRQNIAVMHYMKSWMEKIGMNGSWSQGTGLVSKQMSNINITRTDNN